MARRGRVRWAVTVLAVLLAGATVAGRWWSLSYVWRSPAGELRDVEVGGGVIFVTWISLERPLQTGWRLESSRGWEWGWFGNPLLTRMSWRWGFLRFVSPGAKFFGMSLLNVLGPVLVPAGLLWWARWRGLRGRAEGRCAACGYDRKGLGKGAVCPECGVKAGSSIGGPLRS